MRILINTAARFRCTWIILALTIVGCGEGHPTLAPIHGTASQAGKPLAEAKIVLHPLEPQPEGLPKPIAFTDEAGQFIVTSLSQGDGALPGKYAVTIELRALRQAGEEMIRDGKNLLPGRFADPSTTETSKEVAPGENIWHLEIPLR